MVDPGVTANVLELVVVNNPVPQLVVYHFQLALYPFEPPLIVSVVEFPGQIVYCGAVKEVGSVEILLTVSAELVEVAVHAALIALRR